MRARHGVAAVLSLGLVACASAGPTAPPGPGPRERPGYGVEGAPDAARPQVWFAVRASRCELVIDALARFAGQPGVVAPDTVRTREAGPWCALAGHERRGVRADSWAQNASSALRAPAIAFYVADGAWSYAVFDAGEPVCAMEAHYGEPVVVGDLRRGAAALGLAADVLGGYRGVARTPNAHRELASLIGFDYPPVDAPSVAVRPIPSADAPAPPPPPAPEPPFEVRQWVVMPPHGVMLVKAIEPRAALEGGEAVPTYVVVAGERTLAVPVATARAMGMRRVVSRADADAVLARVALEIEVADAERYDAERTRRWLAALTAGELLAIADAHRELCEIRDTRKLYALEGAMLDSVRTWLTDELSTAREVQPLETEAALDAACD